LNVLFVCTGNICRSPMAERLARELTAGEADTFTSAGTATHPRVEPPAGTVQAMEEVGIAVEDHRSRSVWEVGDDADVIYALSAEHRDAMLRRWPDRGDDIHLLRPDGRSVADPYGLGIDDYRRARDEIAAAIALRVAAGWGR
jgi:protein-tyrosine phosphatase